MISRGVVGAALIACAVLGGTASAATDSSTAGPVATTRFGDVRGQVDDGINVFKGIPYGAPTGGANRFMPPQEPKPWKSVRNALDYGPSCPQLDPPPSGQPFSPASAAKGATEDCLVLNVWTPGLRDGKKRPVMVWMHGGGFTLLSGSSTVYDGVRLAKRGDVVLVTLNHRLNLFGYLYLAGLAGGGKYADSGNVGQLDLVAALHWVHDNIEAFGGDPGNVMIFGESGGGGKVSALLASPTARGLFHRAALQSGFGLTAITPEAATKMTHSVLDALQLRADQIDRLQKMPVEPILAALQKVTNGLPFGIGPVVDGRSLPRHPFTPDAPEVSRDIPILLGYNKTETTYLFPPPGAFDLDWPGLAKQLATALPRSDVPKVIDGWRKLHPQATPSDLYFMITTESTMGLSAGTLAVRKSAQGAAPVFLYRLEWETPVAGGRMRSPHTLDIPLVFDNVAKGAGIIGTGAQQAQQVSDVMSAAWLAFARYGTPNAAGLPELARLQRTKPRDDDLQRGVAGRERPATRRAPVAAADAPRALELHPEAGSVRAAERVEQNHVRRALIARRNRRIAIEQVLHAGEQLETAPARNRQFVARAEIHVDRARHVIRVDAVRQVHVVALLLGADQRGVEHAIVDEAAFESEGQRSARERDEAVDLPVRQSRATTRNVVARDAGAVDGDAGDIRRRKLHQAGGEDAVVESGGPDAVRIVELEIHALRVQAIQVLEDRAHERHRAVRVEVHQVAVHTLSAAASDQQLRRECGNGVGEVDVVVVDRAAEPLEHTRAANGEARRDGVRGFRREARVTAALRRRENAIHRLERRRARAIQLIRVRRANVTRPRGAETQPVERLVRETVFPGGDAAAGVVVRHAHGAIQVQRLEAPAGLSQAAPRFRGSPP